MSRYTHDQLREFLDKQFQMLVGTVDPSDAEVLDIYTELQRKLYPTKTNDPHVSVRSDREEVKKLRRAIEMVYPWVRTDTEVKGIQSQRKQVKAISVIQEQAAPNRGVVILHGARVGGQSDVIRFEGIVPQPGRKTGRFDPARPLPLHVLLTHLVEFEGVASPDTPVYFLRGDSGMRPDLARPLEVDSAMPLSAFLDAV